ncbi:hypothetical protein [Mucilaginibacter sp.]
MPKTLNKALSLFPVVLFDQQRLPASEVNTSVLPAPGPGRLPLNYP